MTNSAEQELEGTIWAAMTAHKVTTKEPLEFIETLKAATLSTGHVVPPASKVSGNYHPQAVDNP